MKKAFSKSLSWLLSVVMIFGIFVVGDLTEVNATGSITTQDIQRVLDKYGYTTGSYWTMWDYPNYGGSDCGATVQTINSELYASSNPATSSSSNVQSWKSYNFNNAWQCHGFALYVMSKVTGNTVSSAGGTNWTKITSKPSYLQVGDIIHTSQHTAVVLTADNGRYTFAECWGSKKYGSQISIGKGFNCYYYTLDSIMSNDTFQYVLRYGGGSPTPTSYNPQGVLDSIDSPEPGKLHIRGWAFDKDDINAQIEVHVYVGGIPGSGAPGYGIVANTERTDVNAAYSVGNYHGFDTTIDVSPTGTKTVYLYAINIGGGNNVEIGRGTVTIAEKPSDIYVPVMQEAYVDNVTPYSFRLNAKVSDNVGVSKVEFETWKDGSPLRKTYTAQSIGNDMYIYDVNISDLTDEAGVYHSIVHAYDPSNNHSTAEIYIIVPDKDTIAPTISDITISQITSRGYRVTCRVSDNVGVTSVRFPTWTDNNVQDDLIWHDGTISGDIATCYINSSEHNNETGIYITHIYAYDAAGNNHSVSTGGINVTDEPLAISSTIYEGHKYIVYNSGMSWTQAKEWCESNGGYLACTATESEWNIVKKLLAKFNGIRCWLGADCTSGTWKWLSGESISGSWIPWGEGQPDKGGNIEFYLGTFGNTWTANTLDNYLWNDYVDSPDDIGGFVFEKEITPTTTGNYNGHKYEYYNETMDWWQAYRFCEKKGGHLVTVTSEEENNFVVELAKSRSDNLWVGARTSDGEKWFWLTGEEFNYNNWDDGEPNNLNGTQDALQIYVSGKWDDVASSDKKVFVCEYDNSIDSTKYESVYKENYNGHEYWFFEDTVDWQTAKKICEAKGGHLVIIDNENENSMVYSGIQKTSKSQAWIGTTDIAKEGVWRDVKGNLLKYTNWHSLQPDNWNGNVEEDYALMWDGGTWNDCSSFGAIISDVGFVCEFDKLCTFGHTYTDEYVEATETETAHIIHKCSVCGYEWTESKTVFFETNGGTPVKAIDLLNKTVYGELPVPTKDGYTFKGWSLTENNTNSSLFTHDTAIYFQVPESWRNVQAVFCHLWSTEREDPIYAWQSEQEICENMGNGLYKYTIPSGTDANGVIFSSSSGYQTYDLAIGTVCENDVLYCVQNIPRSSYIYEGAWTVNKEFKSIPSSWYDGEGLVNGMVDPETIVINSYKFVNADTAIEQKGNHTLYAIWEIKHYTISYNMNGGNGTISKQTKTHGKDLTLSATIPTRTDYKFVGWNTDKNATTAKYQPSGKYTANSNATLYAIWTVNHNYTAKVVAPTCTEKGYTLHTCTNCGDSYKDTYVNALGHDYKLASEKTATCTTDGEKIYTCSRCGDTKTETVKATGHSYTTKVVAPTCTAKGYTLHTCKNCNESYKDTYTNALGHDYKLTSEKAATCTTDGEKIYTCSRCGDTKTETVKATGHSYTTKVIAPTCTEKGYTLHTCSKCGDNYKDTYTNATGHKYEETIVTPTTTEQGYTLHTCSVCKHSYKDNYTNILLSNNSTLSADTIKLGETIIANAKATGGTGEYLYQVVYKQTTQSKWTTAQSYKANATVTFKPANAVTYDVCVKVKDSNNTEVKKFFTVKVTSDELKNVSTISAQTINLGNTVTVNAKATGSTGFYTYAVYYKQKAQTKWTTKQDFKANNTIAVKPAKATTYDICVKVKDDKGTIVKKYFTVNVTDFTNTSTLSATEIKLGNTVKVSCSATGSTGYYQYAVYYKKTSDTKWTTKQSYSSNNTVTIKPAKATTYDVCVKVKDNQNNEVKKYFTVTVK